MQEWPLGPQMLLWCPLWHPVKLFAVPLVSFLLHNHSLGEYKWCSVSNILYHLPHSGVVKVKLFRNAYVTFSKMVSMDTTFSKVLRNLLQFRYGTQRVCVGVRKDIYFHLYKGFPNLSNKAVISCHNLSG